MSNTQLEPPVSEPPGNDDGAAYEVLLKRLHGQGERLQQQVDVLNSQRLEEFGGSRMEVVGRVRIRTEHNCVSRDIACVGGALLFGYKAFTGLKAQTRVEDVFALYRLAASPEGYDVQSIDLHGSWLDDPAFQKDFSELYTYYRDARLVELLVQDNRLLACFQVGERFGDIRVFRWSLEPSGTEVRYIDNRGERDIVEPPANDFDWESTTRDMIIEGRHPQLCLLDSVYLQFEDDDQVLKVDDNTPGGEVLYRTPIIERNQSLSDLQVWFARVGSLILLRIRPYKEECDQYLVCNLMIRSIVRIDAIGQACQQLPEDQGIVFPGGLYLHSGEHRTFGSSMQAMGFKRLLRSPNGEDVLYVFHDQAQGRSALFSYNIISRTMQAPVFGHGYARLQDGLMVIFSAETEPTRNHPVQIWQTPFCFDEYSARQVMSNTFLGRIGNIDLVRGISDLFDLARETRANRVTAARFVQMSMRAGALLDLYHWLGHESQRTLAGLLRDITQTAQAIVDEFEKVESLRSRAVKVVQDARQRYDSLLEDLDTHASDDIQAFVARLDSISELRGHLLSLRQQRYVDAAAINELEQVLSAAFERVAQGAADFMAQGDALLPYVRDLEGLDQQVRAASTVVELEVPLAGLTQMSAGLEVLARLAETLKIEDTTRQTLIAQAVSQVYATLNQAMAHAQSRRKLLGMSESAAQFAARFQLFNQGIAHALGLANTPRRCEEQLAKLLVQLEEMESRFGGHDVFMNDLVLKREEVLERFEQQRQVLIENRQRQALAILNAAGRIIDSLPRRLANCRDIDQLNAFFVTDLQVLKVHELGERLLDLQESVKADDLQARLKAAQDHALRAMRDKTELIEGDGRLLRLGPRHRFSINTQALDLTLLPRGDELWLHITGTDFFECLRDDAVDVLRPCFQAGVESESASLYRSVFLAWQVLESAMQEGSDIAGRLLNMDFAALQQYVRSFSTPLYRQGYERGVHDHDAALILQRLHPCLNEAGLLRYSSPARALAVLVWHLPGDFQARMSTWPNQAQSLAVVGRLFGYQAALHELHDQVRSTLQTYAASIGWDLPAQVLGQSADYLLTVLAQGGLEFQVSSQAQAIVERLENRLEDAKGVRELHDAVHCLDGDLRGQWSLLRHWVTGVCREPDLLGRYACEAAVMLMLGILEKRSLPVSPCSVLMSVTGLLGDHPLIHEGCLEITLDDLLLSVDEHRKVFMPLFQRYQAFRHEVIQRERQALRIEDLQPRPLTSFVRNRLINESYLPLIADNLARQMGSFGDGKRTDLMGLLMLISPPGYGKTTLIEYVAFQLGMAFVKVNGPALGHQVTSLDPAQAPDGPSRMELEKLNLALEMGSNVCLLLDDIQHLSAEFLQKFIALCDGTRRIENVWRGKTKSCDLRGKKFCMVMAGNPYTESGEVFRIPDMLVNRADVYNLGEVSAGSEELFALSYIENCMTSNPVLAPLAKRDMADFYHLVRHVQGQVLNSSDLSHDYDRAELAELIATLRHLMHIRDVLLQVNVAYISSAGQADEYRTEPPFRLQGSYRNMNKLAEKVTAVMNAEEIEQLISDYYRSESRLLTSAAEESLLKLAQIRQCLNEEQAARWTHIQKDFMRNKLLGGDASDIGNRIVAQLGDVATGLRSIAERPHSVVSVQSLLDSLVEARKPQR